MLSRLVCARKKREKEQEQQQNMGIGHAMGVPTAHYYICSAWDGGGGEGAFVRSFFFSDLRAFAECFRLQ